MEVCELDFEDLDDKALQAFDPNNPKPEDGVCEESKGAEVEKWRAVQRGAARKQAELVGQAIAAKRSKCG